MNFVPITFDHQYRPKAARRADNVAFGKKLLHPCNCGEHDFTQIDGVDTIQLLFRPHFFNIEHLVDQPADPVAFIDDNLQVSFSALFIEFVRNNRE